MARSKRKVCLVRNAHLTGGTSPCENKIKPGSVFCREHHETHRVVMRECSGEAHRNPFIDHCMVCLPHWGEYPVAIPKDAPLPADCREAS